MKFNLQDEIQGEVVKWYCSDYLAFIIAQEDDWVDFLDYLGDYESQSYTIHHYTQKVVFFSGATVQFYDLRGDLSHIPYEKVLCDLGGLQITTSIVDQQVIEDSGSGMYKLPMYLISRMRKAGTWEPKLVMI